ALLTLRVQDRWPAANRNIFCLREKEPPGEEEVIEEVERLPVVALQRRGVRLSVVLDRARYKRCDFLFLKRAFKGKPSEEYEQIYWQTQRSMVQRRPRVSMVSQRGPRGYTVRIASEEKYPWRFPGAVVERALLPAGDYALVDGERLAALVERKTLENLLADFGVMPVLHQRLLELSTFSHHALVIEAPYEDFLNARKTHHYTPAYCARLIASLYAEHPNLRIVFCANRKTANEWTRNYFAALWSRDDGGEG
ncbi:MAG TPA: ERCC4 domain-containing protein, partial [Dehalococcoidia bacterium]|nr:ERCC4 domain-containing protein [Dehalococcoidia bacterium]